ncbi:MAG: alpha-ketoacid dehydrogenase subunit beta [Candidatus Tectomicrobia bacterium]|uniref:Alpha-ketoacid dehydrogenase subunit beta n=1 Tax=Tectimicrobiota bacterium TaxID=2528274 RepID=A0A933GMR3_UNCTE|nr:alpha-ketoacid dehydrogenase subunit beta [Candidatus Tectomicrobia bacterium]
MKKIKYFQALNEALKEEMTRDPSVYVAGEDVGLMGGSFGVTRDLLKEFGEERVRDTPISEAAIIGSAVGAAVTGMRPVVEVMFIDFAAVCMDQIVNQAAKMRYMFGGKAKLPITIRMCGGAGFAASAQHSQSLEAWFTHIPGLKVIIPSDPYDAKGLLKTAIRDDNPVIFIEHKLLYGKRGEIPEEEYTIPFGKALIRREGTDLTLITWGKMVDTCLSASEKLANDGIMAEVIDLRTLAPLDKEAIFQSVKKTGKVVIVHEACLTSGFGGEIAALIADEVFDYLDAPVKRVAAPDAPIPFNPILEKKYLPDEDKVVKAVKQIM